MIPLHFFFFVRVIPKLAADLAHLHTIDFDPEYGEEVKGTFLHAFFAGQLKAIHGLLSSDCDVQDRVCTYAKELGQDTCEYISNQSLSDLLKKDCLAHSDTHVFNILVEKKPDISTLEYFGPDGRYVLCDWELTMSSCVGRDIGLTFTFPVACIIAHAMNGNRVASEHILTCMDLLWTAYSSTLIHAGNKHISDLPFIYRSVMGQLGCFLFTVYYNFGAQVEFLPLEGDQMKLVRESMGFLGLTFMMIGFDPNNADASLEDLLFLFHNAMEKEINMHIPVQSSRPFRRSSLLRESGTRVSDSTLIHNLF